MKHSKLRFEPTDGERFSMAVSGITGKRVTYDQLTGKAEERPAIG